MSEKPWVSGPKELLAHAELHLQGGDPFDYRIAMISIDNAIELAIRTFLGLPERIRGSKGPSRRELENAIGFPELLDLFENFGQGHLSGVELGDIEWYHRLRNALYHDGNGVTVDSDKVDAYHQIARLLFTNLFGTSIESQSEPPAVTLLGEFIIKWANLEMQLRKLAEKNLPKYDRGNRSAISYYDGLIAKGIIPATYRTKLEDLTNIRNSVVHSQTTLEAKEFQRIIKDIDIIISQLPTN